MQTSVLSLWPDRAPGSEGWSWEEEESFLPSGDRVIRNVSRPSLTCYLPDSAVTSGAAVIICPGGAFHFQSIDFEGTDVARWLVEHGIAAFVCKYRLLRTSKDFLQEVAACMQTPDALNSKVKPLYPLLKADIGQALRLVRSHAEFHVNPKAVGVLGFSAGAVVAVLAALTTSEDVRPNFLAPVYCGPLPEESLPIDAPPLFLLCANDDEMAITNSWCLYNQYHASHLPVELHIYNCGGHGFGMKKQGTPVDDWIQRFDDWMRSLDLIK